MTVRVNIKCKVKEPLKEQLNDFLKENLPNVRRFSGCQRVAILFNDFECEMLIDEDWQSIEHHQDYISFIQGNGVFTKLISFFIQPPIVSYYQYTSL